MKRQDDWYGIKRQTGKSDAIVYGLNREGGEAVHYMKKLYGYIVARLHQPKTRNDLKAFENVVKRIEIMEDAWSEMLQVHSHTELNRTFDYE